jgi:regulator of protease activity HflC (stomatin/prohibitin superfamily)
MDMKRQPFGEPEYDPAPHPGNVGGGVKELLRSSRLSLPLLALVLVALYFGICTTYVGPGEFAAKQVLYSPLGLLGPMGTHPQIYDTGIHHQFPTLEKLLTFPKTVQVLTMRSLEHNTKGAESGSATDELFTRLAKAAHIQTSDGFYVDLDVSILYQIEDPVKLVNMVGAGKLYEDNGVMAVAENAIKIQLGSLQPEDFFNPATRVAKLEEARDLMNEKLGPMGLRVKHVLARYPHLHPDVAAKIEENNLQKQTKLLNVSLTAQSAAEAALAEVVNKGLAAKSVALQKGAAYKVERSSAMERYSRTRKAEGDKVRKMAEAQKSQLINDAYKGAGSEAMVGMRMANNLTNLDTILVPMSGPGGFSPLDLNTTLHLFSVATNTPAR